MKRDVLNLFYISESTSWR